MEYLHAPKNGKGPFLDTCKGGGKKAKRTAKGKFGKGEIFVPVEITPSLSGFARKILVLQADNHTLAFRGKNIFLSIIPKWARDIWEKEKILFVLYPFKKPRGLRKKYRKLQQQAA